MRDNNTPDKHNTELTILIVEDELFNYIYFSEVLKLHGIQALKAENGEEALEAVQQYPSIDLILMDIKMPFMDGYEAFTEIRKLRPNLPVIAQTAYALSHERKEILDYGFNDYIAKPVDEDQLLDVIRQNLKDPEA